MTALLDPLHDPDQMILLLRWAGRSSTSVVLEISEKDPVADLERLRAVTAAYREHGIRFAVGDVGGGRCPLALLAAVQPEFITLGVRLVSGAHRRAERAMIAAVAAFAHETGAPLIAEGVEDEATARCVAHLGAVLGRGRWFGLPLRPPQPTAVN